MRYLADIKRTTGVLHCTLEVEAWGPLQAIDEARNWVAEHLRAQHLYDIDVRPAQHRNAPAPVCTQHMGVRRTALGAAEYVRVYAADYRALSWDEVWAAFTAVYPDLWAVESFPPPSRVMNEANVYHLLAFERCPQGFDLFEGRR
jgi:hypothetical protein